MFHRLTRYLNLAARAKANLAGVAEKDARATSVPPMIAALPRLDPALWLYTEVAFVTCTPARSYHKCDQSKLRVRKPNEGEMDQSFRYHAPPRARLIKRDIIPSLATPYISQNYLAQPVLLHRTAVPV